MFSKDSRGSCLSLRESRAGHLETDKAKEGQKEMIHPHTPERTKSPDEKRVERLANEPTGRLRRLTVDKDSETWAAINRFIEDETANHAMSILRNRSSEHGDTQYARGMLDAFESLLSLGE